MVQEKENVYSPNSVQSLKSPQSLQSLQSPQSQQLNKVKDNESLKSNISFLLNKFSTLSPKEQFKNETKVKENQNLQKIDEKPKITQIQLQSPQLKTSLKLQGKIVSYSHKPICNQEQIHSNL